MDRLPGFVWFPRWRCSPPASRRACAVPPCPMPRRIKPKTGSLALALLYGRTHRADLRAEQLRRQLEAQRVFREQPRFPIKTDIISIVLDRKIRNPDHARSSTDRILELRLEI